VGDVIRSSLVGLERLIVGSVKSGGKKNLRPVTINKTGPKATWIQDHALKKKRGGIKRRGAGITSVGVVVRGGEYRYHTQRIQDKGHGRYKNVEDRNDQKKEGITLSFCKEEESRNDNNSGGQDARKVDERKNQLAAILRRRGKTEHNKRRFRWGRKKIKGGVLH